MEITPGSTFGVKELDKLYLVPPLGEYKDKFMGFMINDPRGKVPSVQVNITLIRILKIA